MMNSLVMYRFTNDICSCLWMKRELIVETLSEDMDTALMEEPLNHVKYQSEVNCEVFFDFLERYFLPCLMPFNGKNPYSVVILDNCSVHHVAYVTKLVRDIGAILHYLPPYSPDFNLIEWCFSKVNSLAANDVYRRHEH